MTNHAPIPTITADLHRQLLERVESDSTDGFMYDQHTRTLVFFDVEDGRVIGWRFRGPISPHLVKPLVEAEAIAWGKRRDEVEGMLSH